MARTDNLTNFLTDVADSIRTKTGGTDLIQASEFDNQIASINTGITPNGIIESYYAYAGENISAGDFVKFVNGVSGMIDYGESSRALISYEASGSTTLPTGHLVSENRVLIVYHAGIDSSNNIVEQSGLYASLLEIQGNIVNIINTTYIVKTSNIFRTLRLSSGEIVLAFCNTSNYSAYVMLITVEGDNINVGTSTQLSISCYSPYFSMVLMPNGNIFLSYIHGSDYLYGVGIKIENGVVTKGTVTQILAQKYNYNFMYSTALSDTGILLTFETYQSYYKGIVVTMSESLAITVGSQYQLASQAYSPSGAAIHRHYTLSDGRILLIAEAKASSSNVIYGIFLSVSGTKITVDKEQTLYSGVGNFDAVQYADNKFALVCSSSANLYGSIFSIDGNTITTATLTKLSSTTKDGYSISATLLKDNIILVTNVKYDSNDGYPRYAQVFKIDEENNMLTNYIKTIGYETQVKLATEAPFDGIAKTSGEGGTETEHKDQVEIYTL